VHWGGSTRATEFVSATVLRASINASDLAAADSIDVTVENPGSGGGMSSIKVFAINPRPDHPVPVLTRLDPDQAPVGTAALLVTVHGTGFVPASVVRWRGIPIPTEYVDGTRLTASVSADNLSIEGIAPVTVSSPAPGGGVTTAVLFSVVASGLRSLHLLALPAYDLISDPTSGLLYAALAGTGGARANSLTKIDPAAATIGTSVFVGSEPKRIARSDDGQFLYVALQGAAAVRRYNVAAGAAEIQFALGSDQFFGPMYAEDIAVLPGLPHTVAISTMWMGLSPRHAGVRIYDDGVVRPTATAQHTGSNELEAATATTLYGANTETTEFGIRTMSVTTEGVTITQTFGGLSSFWRGDHVLAGGLLYTPGGSVIDPVAGQVVGSFTGGSGPLAVDLPNDRVFFLSEGNILVYQPSNFAFLGTITIHADFGPGRLVRWGVNGLAFIAGTTPGGPGTTIYLLTTTFLPAS